MFHTNISSQLFKIFVRPRFPRRHANLMQGLATELVVFITFKSNTMLGEMTVSLMRTMKESSCFITSYVVSTSSLVGLGKTTDTITLPHEDSIVAPCKDTFAFSSS
eukprot:m.26472 g.26472  ORF g.26472 m.26472 type:complete len:106 (-) comp7802_c0_seq1:5540-5857(-)